MLWTVYCHQNVKNGKKYFGITSQNLERRWREGKGYERCVLFGRAIKKYGWENFEHFVLYENVSEEEAKFLEKYLIEEFQTQNKKLGYNITGGGDGTVGLSPWNKGVKNCFSEDVVERMTQKQIGRKHSEETKKKMSEAQRKRYSNEEERMKISRSMKGKKVSEETKKKLSRISTEYWMKKRGEIL